MCYPFITHNIGVVQRITHRIATMRAGRIEEHGAELAYTQPQAHAAGGGKGWWWLKRGCVCARVDGAKSWSIVGQVQLSLPDRRTTHQVIRPPAVRRASRPLQLRENVRVPVRKLISAPDASVLVG